MTKPLPKELITGGKSSRWLGAVLERASINVDARTVEMAFSSETPISRWFGNEILDHNPESIRIDRIKRGGALLMDHDWVDQVGVIESVWIDADRKGRAVVRFGKSARAQEIFQDVIDGIRTNVSVSYRVYGAVLEETKDGVETYRITDWEPLEISIVSVPADISVGVGRSAEQAADAALHGVSKTTQTPTPSPNPETRIMPENTEHAAAVAAAGTTAVEGERKRTSEILAIADQYGEKFPKVRELAMACVRDNTSADQFRAKALEMLATAPKATSEVGMSSKEVRQYSVVRALHYLANPGDRRAAEPAGFEIECSRAAADRAGKAAQGLLIPFDVLKRDLTVGTAADGGNLVATNLLSGSFIDLLRDAMVLPDLGAQVLTGLVGNIAIPKQSGAGTAYWLAESGAPTESKQAIAQVPMAPKTVGAVTDISRKLLLQSSIDVEAFVQRDLAQVLGLAIQSAAISGGGSQPAGILSTAGIGSVAGGTDGAAPTWANIVELETDVSVANAAVGTLAYLTNAKVRGKLKTASKVSGQNGFIWEAGDNPLNGYRAGVTNVVPSNLTKGAGTNLSAVIFGNFADLILGMWGGLDLTVDPYSNSTSGTVRVVALQDVDVAIRHAESFSAMVDAVTV